MRNWVNWLLVGAGGILIIAEVILGAITGFDLALVGASLAAGGALGLAFGSTKVGLFASGALALVYLLFFRRWIKSKLAVGEKPTNVDALIGRTGVVLERLAAHTAGRVKVEGEIWRAELADAAGERLPEDTVTVVKVEGVTLKVR
jgi:membrane protein implicated in regulation of membrane protease activity